MRKHPIYSSGSGSPVALEHGLSRDDLEYAFGEDFVTEMENREQMQQAEKNNDDLNLE